jgi:hypothetical protein
MIKLIRKLLAGKARYDEHECLRCGNIDFDRLKIAGKNTKKNLKKK